MEEMYNVSSNPHVRDKMTTSRIWKILSEYITESTATVDNVFDYIKLL